MAEIRNPNLQTQGSGGSGGNGGDMRSMLVLTFLALVVLLGVQYFKPKPASPPSTAPAPAQSQAAPTAQPSAAPGQPQLAPGALQAPTAAPAVAATAESLTTVENDKYKIVFTNKGAQVKHWVLKGYNDTGGKPLDMVQPQAAEHFGFPLSLFTYEPDLTAQLNQALYQVSASGAQPSATGHAEAPATNALTFRYAANGLEVVKTVRFDSSFVVTIESQVKRNGAAVRALVAWPAGLGDMEEFLPSSLTRSQVPTPSQFAWALEGKPDSIASKKVSGNATLDLPYEYAGIIDLYFAATFLPDAPERTTVVTLHNTLEIPSVLSSPPCRSEPHMMPPISYDRA